MDLVANQQSCRLPIMPVGGKLLLKGGESLPVEKKIKKKKQAAPASQVKDAETDPTDPNIAKPIQSQGISIQSGKTYEDEFEFEKQRRKEAAAGKAMIKNTPWGSSYRAAPEILHGYTKKVTGSTAEERLDMRAATKSDKFAK